MDKQQSKSYRIVASELEIEHENKDKIFNTFFALSDFFKKYPNPGACHLISSVFHILLKEQGIENTLCIGEVKTDMKFFDHSWIEINDQVFDIAIQLTLDEKVNPPVYFGVDLATERATSLIYGAKSHIGFDSDAKQVLQTPFVKYMDGYPLYREGAWKIVKSVGKEIKLKININDIKGRYYNTTRVIK
ncbi:lasso peptide biosynthesis protein [Rossellomorea vietnamensis]|uniref:lasso peptide biosynthesis protein n=1 Tax=Rossellomorea vietnamensis TaxID=218284 RepID=UPI001CCFEEA6|nr:lasso peptide biosynthesis protein [Rossellomorea vietnamensis]MCA0150308.1 lasso peptide biosynthesis protein [Rossellomorea vietnamensis]